MNFKEWLFNEMPISKFEKIGDWDINAKRKYGFNNQDAGILSSQKGVDKIHKSWSNSEQNFEFYFARTKTAYKFLEFGEVSSEWVQQNLNLEIQPKEDAITVIFTNNIGDGKIPMTAWAIAHRLGHAIRRLPEVQRFSNLITYDLQKILKEIYKSTDLNRPLTALAQALGTMKSARDKNLLRYGEFSHELVAQYIITGKIKFNPLPSFLIWGRQRGEGLRHNIKDKEQLEDLQYMIENMASTYEYYINDILSSLEGRMFVM